jgi:hypothetical protein
MLTHGGGPLCPRTDLIAELPLPERGGSLEELRALLHVTGRRRLLVGWLVAARTRASRGLRCC